MASWQNRTYRLLFKQPALGRHNIFLSRSHPMTYVKTLRNKQVHTGLQLSLFVHKHLCSDAVFLWPHDHVINWYDDIYRVRPFFLQQTFSRSCILSMHQWKWLVDFAKNKSRDGIFFVCVVLFFVLQPSKLWRPLERLLFDFIKGV